MVKASGWNLPAFIKNFFRGTLGMALYDVYLCVFSFFDTLIGEQLCMIVV